MLAAVENEDIEGLGRLGTEGEAAAADKRDGKGGGSFRGVAA
ncbi:MAG: hypothetical protein AAGE90_03230 [Pseudomonadota bacterium]